MWASVPCDAVADEATGAAQSSEHGRVHSTGRIQPHTILMKGMRAGSEYLGTAPGEIALISLDRDVRVGHSETATQMSTAGCTRVSYMACYRD